MPAPTGLTATAAADGNVTLSWSAPDQSVYSVGSYIVFAIDGQPSFRGCLLRSAANRDHGAR